MQEVAAVDDELSVGQAAAALGASVSAVRNWMRDHLLRARWTAGGHARIERTSVEELQPLLRIPPGPDRDTAFEQLRARNREWLARRTDPGG